MFPALFQTLDANTGLYGPGQCPDFIEVRGESFVILTDKT